MPNNPAQIGPYCCGQDQPLLLIAGPCVLQREAALIIAKRLCEIGKSLLNRGFEIQIIFKGSFDKANRTSLSAFRGPGLEEGLEILSAVKAQTGLPVTTDIHETSQAKAVGEICDLIQIPAFLSRQTDLLISAAQTGKAVHAKKGQFMSPFDMKYVVGKLEESGCSNILLGERGTFFGYGQLVNDFRSLIVMRQWGTPIVYDATHSVQEPGGKGNCSGGNRMFVGPLAKAAAAIGIDALFLETFPNPDDSPCDGPNMISLDQLEGLLVQVLRIRNMA